LPLLIGIGHFRIPHPCVAGSSLARGVWFNFPCLVFDVFRINFSSYQREAGLPAIPLTLSSSKSSLSRWASFVDSEGAAFVIGAV